MLLVLPILALLQHSFRVVTVENSDVGYVHYKYRWGWVHELTADSNQDGRIDFRAAYSPGLKSVSPHDSPREFWQDADFNGKFEAHAVFNGVDLTYVELDLDQDGEYEETLRDEQAEAYFANRIDKLIAIR